MCSKNLKAKADRLWAHAFKIDKLKKGSLSRVGVEKVR